MITKKELNQAYKNQSATIRNTIQATRLLLNDGMRIMIKDRYDKSNGYISICKTREDTFILYRYEVKEKEFIRQYRKEMQGFAELIQFLSIIFDEICIELI